jgi:hypothetical protein
MGYHIHKAIIVTSWDSDHAERAHRKALKILQNVNVSDLTTSTINGFVSFCIFPDGSKLGWGESAFYEERRDQFKRWIRRHPALYLDWCEVSYGGDEPEVNTKLLDHSGRKRKK